MMATVYALDSFRPQEEEDEAVEDDYIESLIY